MVNPVLKLSPTILGDLFSNLRSGKLVKHVKYLNNVKTNFGSLEFLKTKNNVVVVVNTNVNRIGQNKGQGKGQGKGFFSNDSDSSFSPLSVTHGTRVFCSDCGFFNGDKEDSFEWDKRRGSHGFCKSSSGRTNNEMAPGFILGIETSCDDTGAAVVTTDGKILGEALASQGELHAQWGGIVPYLAQGEHEKAIDGVVAKALKEAKISEKELSAVAVTIGPGLSLCLRVGVTKARAIAKSAQIPIIGVHHMEAHALVARLSEQAVTFPFLTLLISGGHNLLLLAHGVGRYTQLGATLDDALGEAYDKTARLLGLDLSKGGGGVALEEIAKEGDPKRYKFSVPMRGIKNCEFSYAGLKSSVRLAIEKEIPHAERELIGGASPEDRQKRADIAASFQRVAVAHLEDRTRRALEWTMEKEPLVNSLVVAGGVAANRVVRSRLEEVAKEMKVQLICPPPRLCTDNGVMVAWAGVERFRLGLMESPPPIDQPDDAWVDVRPRWPLGEALQGASKSEPLKSAKKRNVFPSLTSLSNPS